MSEVQAVKAAAGTPLQHLRALPPSHGPSLPVAFRNHQPFRVMLYWTSFTSLSFLVSRRVRSDSWARMMLMITL
jgi:hypothetical protein